MIAPMANLTRSLKPVLPADVVRRLQEPPPAVVSKFLAEPYSLAPEQIEHYREHGFVKLERVISGEALRYFREVIGYAVGHYFADDDRAPADKRVYERSFLQAFNLGLKFPAIRPFAHAFRFADPDAAFWPVQPAGHTSTIWVALVEVPRECGCIAFAAGSHRAGATRSSSTSSA